MPTLQSITPEKPCCNDTVQVQGLALWSNCLRARQEKLCQDSWRLHLLRRGTATMEGQERLCNGPACYEDKGTEQPGLLKSEVHSPLDFEDKS